MKKTINPKANMCLDMHVLGFSLTLCKILTESALTSVTDLGACSLQNYLLLTLLPFYLIIKSISM